MSRTIMDYAVTGLLVLHLALMAIWGWFLLTTDLATKDNTGIALGILAIIGAYHWLRYKRNKMRSRALQPTP